MAHDYHDDSPPGGELDGLWYDFVPTEKGNWHCPDLSATAFRKGAGDWSFVRSGSVSAEVRAGRYRGTRDTASHMVDAALKEWHDAKRWEPFSTAWKPSTPKNGRPGFWRKASGRILAVRQAGSGSWYVTVSGELQPDQWFATADEAKRCAEERVNAT